MCCISKDELHFLAFSLFSCEMYVSNVFVVGSIPARLGWFGDIHLGSWMFNCFSAFGVALGLQWKYKSGIGL